MLTELIKQYWSQILGLIFGVIGIGAYVQSKRTDNVSKIQKIYAELITDLKTKLNEVEQLKLKLEKMEVELNQLRAENEMLRTKLEEHKKKCKN